MKKQFNLFILTILILSMAAAFVYGADEVVDGTRDNYGLVNDGPDINVIEDSSSDRISLKETLPSKYDSRQQSWYPEKNIILNQGSYGICWACAAANVARISYCKEKNSKSAVDALSAMHLAYFFFNRQVDPLGLTNGDSTTIKPGKYSGGQLVTWDTYGGNDWFTLFSTTTWQGFASTATCPYPSSYSSSFSYDAKYAYDDDIVVENVNIFDSSSKDKVKEQIKKYGAVTATIYMNTYYLDSTTAGYYVPSSVNDQSTNHEIVIVGWDDSYSKDNFKSENTKPNNNGAWIVMNSWGSNFGDNGYCYVSYEDRYLLYSKRFMSLDMQDADEYDLNYQYDGGGAYTYFKTTAYDSYVNMYDVNLSDADGMNLGAVGFTQYNSGHVDYELKVYKNIKIEYSSETGYYERICDSNYPDPVVNMEVYTDNPGFSTFTFDDVYFENGDSFTIELTPLQSINFATDNTVGDDAYISYNCASVANKSFRRYSSLDSYILSNSNYRIKGFGKKIKNHTHTLDEIAMLDSTCKTVGYKKHYKCSICGELFTDSKGENSTSMKALRIALKDHDCTHVSAKAATCIEPGNSEYWQCKDCEAKYADSKCEYAAGNTSIAAKGHKTVHHAAKAATCLEAGNKEYYSCENCDMVFEDEYASTTTSLQNVTIAKLNHKLYSYTKENEPDCIKAGNYAYYTCSLCRHKFSDEAMTNEVSDDYVYRPPLGHCLNHIDAVEPTCNSYGCYDHYQCGNCGKYYRYKTSYNSIEYNKLLRNPTGHSMTHYDALDASCTEDGRVECWYCSNCKKYYSNSYIYSSSVLDADDIVVHATGHSTTHHDAVKGDCTTDGTIEYWSCSKCKKNYRDAKCELEVSDLTDKASGHALTHHAANPATCTQDGTVEYWSCSKCNNNYSDSKCTQKVTELTDKATGHSMTYQKKKDSTCTASGHNEYYSCSKCNGVFTDSAGKNSTTMSALTIQKKAHSGTHYDKIEPTCQTTGSKEYWECDTCHQKFSDGDYTNILTDVILNKTKHEHNLTSYVKAGYLKNGHYTYKCNNCSDTYTIYKKGYAKSYVKSFKVSKGKKSFTAKWKKQSKKYRKKFKGYQIQYSRNSKMTNAKICKVSNTKSYKTIKNLKSKTKYYVRVRTYTVYKGSTFYSDWSKKKTVKTK